MKAKIHKRGTSFRGVLNYAFKSQSTYICGNMSGTNPKDLSKEFGVARQMRPDVDKPIWHTSLSLPKGECISDEKWAKITEKFMKEMEFTDLNQFTVLKHEDTDYQHVHIIANRIGLDGSLWYGQREALKAIDLTQKLEKEFGLTITAGLESGNGKKTLTKGEIEMSIRTGEAPAKQILQNTIDTALNGKQSIFAFMEKLEKANIKVIPNVAKTGKVSGLSFECDGIYFKGSQLGKKYAWNELIKRGVTYEQDREGQKLIERAEQIKAASGVEPVGVATVEPTPVGQNSRTAEQVSADSRDVKPEYVAVVPGVESVIGTSNANDKISNTRLEDNARAVQGSDRASKNGNIEPEKVIDMEGVQRVVTAGHNAWSGVGAVLSDLNATSPSSVLKPDHIAKINAWKTQHEALLSDGYRITCMSRDPKKGTFNLGKRPDGTEKIFTNQEVEKKIPELRAKNAQGYDIYVTPMDSKYHYLVIDDIKTADVEEVKKECQPCLVQMSSEDNYQAVVMVKKLDYPNEQQVANKLVVDLNTKYGDKKFSGVIHPFRMAGFSNKKEGRKNFITRVVDNMQGLVTSVFDKFMNNLRVSKPVVTKSQASKTEFEALLNTGSDDKLVIAFNNSYKKIIGLAEKNGWNVDASVVDFNVAKDLLKTYHSRDVFEAMKNSPDIKERHKDVDRYLTTTINNAKGGSNGYKI